jgi:hypothetical protein
MLQEYSSDPEKVPDAPSWRLGTLCRAYVGDADSEGFGATVVKHFHLPPRHGSAET